VLKVVKIMKEILCYFTTFFILEKNREKKAGRLEENGEMKEE